MQQGIVSEEFVERVIGIDFGNPFSQERCALLALVPEAPSSNWQERLLAQLPPKQISGIDFLSKCQATINNFLELFIDLLIQRREDISMLEISKNPRGQILEPGFRVIFPFMPKKHDIVRLNSECKPEIT